MNSSSPQHIVYVTRDLERALGVHDHTEGFSIVTNFDSSAKASLASELVMIENEKSLDTRELLAHPDAIAHINKQTSPAIVVFKPSKQIERISAEQGWNLLNPSSDLSSDVENKVSAVHWLGELAKLLPAHHLAVLGDVDWYGTPFILQFNRAHTGSGTHLIESQAQLDALKTKFPARDVRIVEVVDGPMFTSNNIVHAGGVLVGNVSYQITGLTPFTDNPFATIGNDWAYAHERFDADLHEQHRGIVELIGEKLRYHGYKGLFGVDVILDNTSGKLMLIEINARQPASTTFESMLQRAQDPDNMTTFEAHLQALAGKHLSGSLAKVTKGAQIIQRVTETFTAATDKHIDQLHAAGYTITRYDNKKSGADALRVQTVSDGLMKTHQELNADGVAIATALRSPGATPIEA